MLTFYRISYMSIDVLIYLSQFFKMASEMTLVGEVDPVRPVDVMTV